MDYQFEAVARLACVKEAVSHHLSKRYVPRILRHLGREAGNAIFPPQVCDDGGDVPRRDGDARVRGGGGDDDVSRPSCC